MSSRNAFWNGKMSAAADELFSRLCWVFHTIEPALIRDVISEVLEENGSLGSDADLAHGWVEPIVMSQLSQTFEDDFGRAMLYSRDGKERRPEVRDALMAGDITEALIAAGFRDGRLSSGKGARGTGTGAGGGGMGGGVGAGGSGSGSGAWKGRSPADVIGFRYRAAEESEHYVGSTSKATASSSSSVSYSSSASSRSGGVSAGLSPLALELCETIPCACGAGRSVLASPTHTRACTESWYAAARARVDVLAERRAQQFQKANELRSRSGGGAKGVYAAAASAYSSQAHTITQQMEAANEAASHALFILQNPGLLSTGSYGHGSGSSTGSSSSSGSGSGPGRGTGAGAGAGAGTGAGAASRGSGGHGSHSSSWASVASSRGSSSGSIPIDLRASSTASGSSYEADADVPEVDLHGQHAEEAVTLLRDVVLPQAADNRVRMLRIVTGRGTHAHGGTSRVRDAVGKFLRAHKGKIFEGSKGSSVLARVDPSSGGGGFEVWFS
jgi:hypothetical protein